MSADRPGLFQGFGVELEYMIVDRTSLAVRPVADQLFMAASGSHGPEIERGDLAWSNEVVSHVVELKTNGPASTLEGLSRAFHGEVRAVRELLEPLGATLLGGGAHPFMEPEAETRLWPFEYSRVYQLYDRVFGCRGHGWSNLQSTHLNLPFRGDEEFGRLHAAVRVVLPLIPGLCAASPILDGRIGEFKDARLAAYRRNQARLPSLTGAVVPEPVFSEEEYRELIFEPIRREMAPHDPDGITDVEWLNSRGAIARFSRGSIEVRLVDAQESPLADLAVVEALVAVIRGLAEERWSSTQEQRALGEHELATILLEGIRDAEEAPLSDPRLGKLVGARRRVTTLGELWRDLMNRLSPELPSTAGSGLERILAGGTLATRILRALGPGPKHSDLLAVYGDLERSMAENTIFSGRSGRAPEAP